VLAGEECRLVGDEAAEKARAPRSRRKDVNGLIRATWKRGQYVVTSAGMRSENSYIFGTRALYKWATDDKGLLDFAKLQSLAQVPIFTKGPHSGELNLTAPEFGYYNPDFVRWARDHAIPASADLVPEASASRSTTFVSARSRDY
jgi:hypothetical protein